MTFGFLLAEAPMFLNFLNQSNKNKLEMPTGDWLASSFFARSERKQLLSDVTHLFSASGSPPAQAAWRWGVTWACTAAMPAPWNVRGGSRCHSSHRALAFSHPKAAFEPLESQRAEPPDGRAHVPGERAPC